MAWDVYRMPMLIYFPSMPKKEYRLKAMQQLKEGGFVQLQQWMIEQMHRYLESLQKQRSIDGSIAAPSVFPCLTSFDEYFIKVNRPEGQTYMLREDLQQMVNKKIGGV